jgi:hypothetical protein
MTDAPRTAALPAAVPPGTRLVHIGFYKTGTTAVQTRFSAVRDRLPEHGVTSPASSSEQWAAANAVIGRTRGWADDFRAPIPIRRWQDLVRATAGSPPDHRVFISSEFLADADADTARRIVEDLGGADRVHIVATMRPLSRLIPSSWQQNLKAGERKDLDAWIRASLRVDPGQPKAHHLWKRHDYPTILGRWADVVGPDRVTAVALDPSDRRQVFDTLCAMLGISADVLDGAEDARAKSNRSLGAAEAELLRRLNVAAREAELPWRDYASLVRYGAVERMVENGTPDGATLALPAWAIDRCAEIGRGLAERIDALGVNTAGDLSVLAWTDEPADVEVPSQVSIDTAVEAILGAISAARSGKASSREGDVRPNVTNASARDLASELARRARRKTRGR